MTLRDSQKTTVGRAVVLVLLVISSLISGMAVADHTSDTNEAEPFEESIVPQGTLPDSRLPVMVGEKYYGVNGSNVIYYWSSDSDSGSQNLNANPGSSSGDLNQTEQTKIMRDLANQNDLSHIKYPASVFKWNKNNWDAFKNNFSASVHQSYYPEGADTLNDKYISDAHATIYWITGSRHVYRDSGESILWLPRSATLRGMVDYRVDLPRNDSDASDDSMTLYSLESTEISKTCIVGYDTDIPDCESSQVIARGDTGHLQDISYKLTGSRPSRIAFRAEINTTIEVSNRVRRGNESDPNWKNSTYTKYDKTAVAQGIDYEIPPKLGVDVQRAKYPNGSVDFAFNFTSKGTDILAPSWQTIDINGSDIVSKWRYFTLSKSGWNKMHVSTEKTTSYYHPIATPISIRTYPTGNVTSESGDQGYNSIKSVRYRSSVDSPEVGNGISAEIEGSGSTYRPTRGVLVHHGDGIIVPEGYDASEVGVSDIDFTSVGGGPVHVREKYTHKIKKTNLEMGITKNDGSTFTVNLELTDLEGNPIDLQGSNRGHISIAEKNIETGPNGEATVQIPTAMTGVITAKFKPTPWYEMENSKTAYTSSTADYYRTSYNGPGDFLIYLLDVLFLPVLLLLCLYVTWNRSALLGRI